MFAVLGPTTCAIKLVMLEGKTITLTRTQYQALVLLV